MPDEIRFLAVTPNIDRAIREKLLGNSGTTDLTGDETYSRKQELVSDISAINEQMNENKQIAVLLSDNTSAFKKY